MRVHEVGAHRQACDVLAAVGRGRSGERPAATATGHRPAYLVKGADPSLVAQAAHALVEQLVAGGRPVDDGRGVRRPGRRPVRRRRGHRRLHHAARSWSTAGWWSSARPGRSTAADAKRLVAYLADPLPTTALVLVAGGGTVNQALSKAVAAAGEVVDTSVGTGRARSQWLADHLKGGPVRLDGPAQARLGEHLGSDMGRLAGLLDTLAAAYGRGAPR